uniref:Ras-related protein Rab-33-like n=1 Tax=Crassostrea virginica TaxID=6565 RepID=A0A8B8D3Y5_CRAVI|nr:ras-related protein Rab-33-like [Crassostrea virginica]
MNRNEHTESDDPVKVKVVVIGDMCVGKTAIAHRFTKNDFEDKMSHTVGASYYIRSMEIEGRTILFQIWDTAGQERFRSLVPMYLRDADIALLVYDITSRETFQSLELWRTELLASAPSHVTTAVVGNKSDLSSKRLIEATVARAYASKHRMLYTETSAKLGTNVEELFYDLGLRMANPELGGCIENSIKVPEKYKKTIVKVQIPPSADPLPQKSSSCCVCRTFSPLLPPLSSAPFHCCLWDAAMSSPAAQYDDNLPVKVVIIGDSAVGKTAITRRFVDDTFSETTAMSVGAGYFVKHLEIEDKKVFFQIWDTAGQESFRSLVPMFLRNSKIALLVYDITKRESFDHLDGWRTDLISMEPDVLVAVIGNKSDLKDKRVVEVREGQGYANKLGMKFTETSAKRGTNVEEIFFELGSQLLQRKLEEKQKETVKVRPGGGKNMNVRNCCL